MLQQVRKTESSIINCLIFLNILMVFWFVFFLIMIIKQKEKNHYFGVSQSCTISIAGKI